MKPLLFMTNLTRILVLTLALLLTLSGCGEKGEKGVTGQEINVIANLSEEDGELELEWTILEKPENSQLSDEELEFTEDLSEMFFTPDEPGSYAFEVKVFQYYGDELSTQTFQYSIKGSEEDVEEEFVEEKLGRDEDSADEALEDEDWLNVEIIEDTAAIQDVWEESELSDSAPAEMIAEERIPEPEVVKEAPVPVKVKPLPGSSIPYDKTRFTIQVTSKRSLDDAETMAAMLMDAGYDAYIQKAYFKENDELWYRVRIGSYESHSAAMAVAKSIKLTLNATAWVDHVRFED